MKKGQIVKLNHPAFGVYGLVTKIEGQIAYIMGCSGIRLDYELNDAKYFETVGFLSIGKKYSVMGKRFCRVTINEHTHDVCVKNGPWEESRADEIRKMAFSDICEKLI